MGFGCAKKTGKIYLVTTNAIFMLFGLGLIVIGIILGVNNDTFRSSDVRALLNRVSLNDALDLGTTLYFLFIYIIAIGSFITCVAALGAIGACLQNRFLLLLYAIIVLVILVMQIVVVALFFTMRDKLSDDLYTKLTAVFPDYEGVDSTNSESMGWDKVFVGYKCCGVDKVRPNENSNAFSGTKWGNNRADPNDKVPPSCCKKANKGNYKNYNNNNSDNACQQSLTTSNEEGCNDAFKNWVYGYQTAAIVTGVILFVVEIAGIVIALIVFCALGKKRKC